MRIDGFIFLNMFFHMRNEKTISANLNHREMIYYQKNTDVRQKNSKIKFSISE